MFFALALVVDAFILGLVSSAEKFRQSEFPELALSQPSATNQQAEKLSIFAPVILGLVVFTLVSLAKQMRQQ
jgi:hypothetical protein